MAPAPLVVGVNGSADSQLALRWASGLASRWGASVAAVYACTHTSADEEQRLVERWSTTAREFGVQLRTMIIPGDPRDVLISAADRTDAELLIVGAGNHTRPGFLHVGSVGESLAHHVTRPLAIVPAVATSPLQRLALGVDGSAESRAAASLWTARLAAGIGASVIAVTVEAPLDNWTSAREETWRHSVEREIRDRWAATVGDAGVPVEAALVYDDDKAAGLLRHAANVGAGLLVVGMRSLHGIPRFRAGGVAMQVLHRTGMPIAFVPAQ